MSSLSLRHSETQLLGIPCIKAHSKHYQVLPSCCLHTGCIFFPRQASSMLMCRSRECPCRRPCSESPKRGETARTWLLCFSLLWSAQMDSVNCSPALQPITPPAVSSPRPLITATSGSPKSKTGKTACLQFQLREYQKRNWNRVQDLTFSAWTAAKNSSEAAF